MPKLLNVNPLFRTKKWLERKYIIEQLSSQKIAEIVNANRKTIDQWLTKHNIIKRGFGGSDIYANYCNKDWLHKKYITEKLSTRAIAKLTNKDWSTIIRWLNFYNIPIRKRGTMISGSNSHFWKGGRYNDKYGYIYIYKPEHPFASSIGYVKEHRLVVEEAIRRYLTSKEVIHHINEIKKDNRRKNLYLFATQKEHASYHYKANNGLAPKHLKSNLLKNG